MKPKKCKVCSNKFEPLRPLQYVCSPRCGYEYAKKQKDKDWKQPLHLNRSRKHPCAIHFIYCCGALIFKI